MIDLNIQKALGSQRKKLGLDIQIHVDAGQFIALYGPSGSGKTSILRMISGLMSPDSGSISLANKTVYNSSKKINIKPQLRDVGFCFQDYALFPNMTVYQNLLFALQKDQSVSKVEQLLEMMELKELENMMPIHLSGGQKQRVALARALVQEPKILLLDEPLSAIDDRMRNKLQEYILKVHHKYQLTTILVSHNIDEVKQLSDNVYVIDNGRIVKEGDPSILKKGTGILNSLVVDAVITNITPNSWGAVLDLDFNGHQFVIQVPESGISGKKIGDRIAVEISTSDIRVFPGY